ncbi:hydantoinase [Caldovatus sediminis]|uniref:Hydantoinase n=1 Tax=Caldovatus sediminis TaxID=2041189 RepID=A0A8J2ZG44_9PROT|nr:hydantoinase/oxoprolinase family protein [Caldovatus sediminis]GGG52286.1 hydantoinase [Caldovatus sediminis]
MRRIGIDVGGTNTDAVLIEAGRLLRSVKAPTTEDVTGGIVAALQRLAPGPGVDAVMIGTTHFVNAVVQRRHLARVGGLRIGAPATVSLPAFTDWPEDLRAAVDGGFWAVAGGHDYDGRAFLPLDRAAVEAAGLEMRARGLRAVAVTALFSPLTGEHEREAAEILGRILPDAAITCSHEVGGIGLLERENGALLNAALVPLAAATVRRFEAAIAALGIAAPLYLTQNDGTVTDARRAARFPVFSFACGPTNSMRGAAWLSGLRDAVVVDVGGTTADFGHLRGGFPREANAVVQVGGVRTLFRMPDLVSIGLGGGSLVDAATGEVGPRSVGYRLTSEALVFGGETLTATDVAVAAGLVALGDAARVRDLPPDLPERVMARIRARIEEHVDRVKTAAGDVTLIAVGGGAFLVPDRLAGVARVLRVPHGDCANAVGAAIAQVSGEVDQIYQGLSREQAIAAARRLAEARAEAAGAAPGTLSLVEAEDMPVAYLPGNAMRVRVKVVGDIAAA